MIDKLRKTGCEILENEPMNLHTSFKIGGNSRYFITVNNSFELREVIKVLKDSRVPFLIIGNGSNMLVSDNGIKGAVIRLSGDFLKLEHTLDGKIRCGAGVPLSKLCLFALENSLSGLEFAWGIPGTAGGAAFMNAGAYGGEMKDILVSCEHMTSAGEEGVLSNDELDLGYRKSAYSENGFIITALIISLKKGKKDEIKTKMDELLGRRKDKQPLEFPSAGSVFKRPEGFFAGTLIEECGFKGVSVGGAQVSEKHAGFIINKGGATCSDVLELISQIQKKVLDEKGVKLECEIKTFC